MSVGKGSLQRASKAGQKANTKKTPAVQKAAKSDVLKNTSTKKAIPPKEKSVKTKTPAVKQDVKTSVLVPTNPKIVSGIICEIPTYLL